jgi:hypothetical protein
MFTTASYCPCAEDVALKSGLFFVIACFVNKKCQSDADTSEGDDSNGYDDGDHSELIGF